MDRSTGDSPVIAVVIPCYRVTRHIADVIGAIPNYVSQIIVVDDACPDASGRFVAENVTDSRVSVLWHPENQGVGGAVMTGYQHAIDKGAEIILKIDGDGQMDPSLIPAFIAPILAGEADYTKGNRFFDLDLVRAMPPVRLFGNAVLSFMAKLSTGYWNCFDPTNGYTAIHAEVIRELPLHKISRRYFFETDILFRLNTVRAVVVDVPMAAKYGDEVSNLKISKILGEFLTKHIANLAKRIFYNYYLRDLSLGSVELPLGICLLTFGILFGGVEWWSAATRGISTSAGTVMLAALPILVGIQLILAFLSQDAASVPTRPRHRTIEVHRDALKRLSI